MKLIKKIAIGIFALGLSLGAGTLTGLDSKAYAAEATDQEKYKTQKEQLNYAVTDRANVVSSEAYVSYASEDTKAKYEKAVADGAAVLAKGDKASIEELAAATSNINQARSNIVRDVKKKLAKVNLQKAVEKNQNTSQAAKYLIQNYPNTVANVRTELEALIAKSDKLVKQAQALLQKM